MIRLSNNDAAMNNPFSPQSLSQHPRLRGVDVLMDQGIFARSRGEPFLRLCFLGRVAVDFLAVVPTAFFTILCLAAKIRSKPTLLAWFGQPILNGQHP